MIPYSARPSFEALRDAHLAALTGSLIDGVERGPNGACYAWSRNITDPTLNFAFGIRTSKEFAWAGAAALGRGRDPAFLARDADEYVALRTLFEPAVTYQARWMAAQTAYAAASEDVSIAVQVGPVPPAGFESVFAQLSDVPAVKAHLRRYYLPAFRVARGRPDVVPLHLVLSDESGPAACASLMIRGDLAGLYNVSTRADRQRRGLGASITAAALQQARSRGAATVFLQCAAGSLEAFYERLGFATLHAPFLLCTTRP
ncbi:GNAT family N-acetyltransferase [Methylobacterium sp. HMF5984]|uniref:GNAT family N-acetyltransferase n=1 Tax=Methylobacterium sp. HMF5984 TaxID=3367370 RepID=UPI00385460B9